MNFVQINGANQPLNFNQFFANYNQNANFGLAQQNPIVLNSGISLNRGTLLGTGQATTLNTPGSSATVIGMITCTAVIAKINNNNNIYVAHAPSGVLTANMNRSLANLVTTFGGNNPNNLEVVYVIPKAQDLNTYGSDINALAQLGYRVCFVVNPAYAISALEVDSQGNMCIL